MGRLFLIPTIFLTTGVLFSAPALTSDVTDHVKMNVSSSCQAGTGTIDISLTPLGDTQIPGPPGVTILQTEDTGVNWQMALPFFIESPEDYFPEPPTLQLSYLAGPQRMPELIADFAYCPTEDECLFAAERIEVQNRCR